jgi:CBS domain containing-hemolysin-like protein
MLTGALSVTNRVVREIMTPRRRLVTIEATTPIADALAEFSASPYSRFPVTDNGEEIIGLVTLRELFLANEKATATTVAEIAEEPMVVSEVFEVPPLMNAFSEQGIHVAIVVNEFGSISGMVTREDAIEEVFGEFYDEFDDEPDPIARTGSGVSVRGDVLLAILNERFDLALPMDRADTVSGYIWQHLGRLPVVGDTAPLITSKRRTEDDRGSGSDSVDPSPTMRVDSVDGTLVERVSFTLPADRDSEDPE